ncbi:MAG: tRNA (adenosine(37)-N6)-threonylcarbamoyltransferase complex ATPase subunit type 1 TsaE [Kiritimatiellae bacterium]|jgi:tRNA threonylcarbamoyladenosine biosynthesis protein TsaE|nr:tRNA (adenosine(37)-N6)-threonylcarbamoyltransferase complex ATPase subunit type 1 TsaE [Kiritimatiellia bacterium]
MKALQSESPEDTRRIGEELVTSLSPGSVVRLHGDLGAGKTCFVQGMAEGLGWTGPVNSPTYGLIQEYKTTPPLVHVDLYRLTDPEQIWDLGLEEMLEDKAIVAVEWSERVPDFWPRDAWQVELTGTPDLETQRSIHMWRGDIEHHV